MNKTLFTLAVVSAFAAGSAFAATTNVLTENFDSRVLGAIAGQGTWIAGADDLSEVKEGNGGRYLELKTEGSILTNELANASDANGAIAAGGTVVFSSEIKFVASDSLDCGIEGGTDDTKFAIYAYQEDESSPANLVVYHGYVDANEEVQYVNERFTGTVIDTTAFTTVTVTVCRADHLGGDTTDGMFFQVSLNGGAPLETTYEDDYTGAFGANWMRTVNSTAGTAGNFSAICLKGTGDVDNILVDAVEEEAAAGFDGGEEGKTFTIDAQTQEDLEALLPAGAALADVADATSGLTYAQAYALGLLDDTTGGVAPLNATIEFNEDGEPVVTLDATAEAGYEVTCKLYGSTTLPVDTTGTPIATASLGEELTDDGASSDASKFYKIVVTIEDAQ